MLLEKGAPVDAVDGVSTWECGRVREHGHAWESAGLLEGRGGQCVVRCEGGPLEAGADTAIVLCCSTTTSRCT